MLFRSGSIDYSFFNEKASLKLGGNAQYVELTKPKNGFVFSREKNSYWRGTVYLIADLQLSKEVGINYMCYFYPGYDNLVYIVRRRWLMNAGIYYNPIKGNWSISLDANDICRPKKFIEMYYDGNHSRSSSYGSSRYIQLSFILKLNSGENIKRKSVDTEPSRFSKRE